MSATVEAEVEVSIEGSAQEAQAIILRPTIPSGVGTEDADGTEADVRLRALVEAVEACGGAGYGVLLDAVGRTNKTLQRIDDTGWCRCLDVDLDELEPSLRDIEAVAPGRASAVKGLGEAIRGFVYCLSVEMRDWFSHRQGEMAAEVSVWEGSDLSEGNGGCAMCWGRVAGDAGSPGMHPTLPTEPALVLPHVNPTHPIPPHPFMHHLSLAHLSQDRYPFRDFDSLTTEQEIRSQKQLAAGGRGRLWWFFGASTWNALMRALHGSGDGDELSVS